jgi:hypothetical protein
VIIGVILAILLSVSPGGFFILALAGAAVSLIYLFVERKERNFILGIFFTGLGARIILTLVASSWAIFSGRLLNCAWRGCPDYSAPCIIGDSGYYTLRALFTSMYWQGEPLSYYTIVSVVKYLYGFNGFIYILARFFDIFGYSPISSRFINCFLGALIAIIVYSTVKNIFDERPARLAAILAAFFPSVFLWSITNLRDIAVIFAICLMLWSLVKFQKKGNIWYLIITALSLWAQAFINYGYRMQFLFIGILVVSFYVFYLFISNLLLRKWIVCLLVIFIIGAGLGFTQRAQVQSNIKRAIQKAYLFHGGIVATRGISYKLLPDKFYEDMETLNYNDFFKMLGKGWLHIMLEPLPWRAQSRAMLFTFPQMLLWYFLIPFAVLGMGISARYRFKESVVLIAYFLIMTSALALTGGNVGTIFRHRDIITPVLLIFSSVGLCNTFKLCNEK